MTPNIIQAIEDPNLFRPYVTGEHDGPLGTWSNWLAFLRSLYGLPLSESDYEIVRACTGREPSSLSSEGYTECLLLCGRRSGKSKTIALVGAGEAILSGREKGLSKGEIPMVSILSPTRFQSRVIFEYLKGVFDAPLLRNEVVEEKKDGFKLRNKVEVAIITGDPRSVRGFSVIAAIVDEIAFFGFSEESKVRSDTELIRSIRPSLASTGGRLLSVGSPYASKGYAYETFKRAYGNNSSDVLCWNAPSLLMNPTLKESVVKRAIDEDPIAANVEYCTSPGLFREDVDTFITRQQVEALVIQGRKELAPQSGIRYSAFADVSGGRHDDAALAIGHKEGGVIILDCLERFKAPHNPHNVASKMVEHLRRYGVKELIGDAYSAEWSRTTFAGLGINYRRATFNVYKEGTEAKNRVAKPKSLLYLELLPHLHSGGIELLDDDTLVIQLSSLQRRTRVGARDLIDHPPGGKDDLANVVAGVADAVSQRVPIAGAIRSTGESKRKDPFERFDTRMQKFEEHLEKLAQEPTDDFRIAWRRMLRRAGRTEFKDYIPSLPDT